MPNFDQTSSDPLYTEEIIKAISENRDSLCGIGCDIIELDRIAAAISRMGDALIERLFTEGERALSQKLHNPIPFYAARFAAKEALSKALGTGIGKDLSWQDMEILKNPLGKPEVSLSPLVQERFDIGETFLSLSHSATHAMAFCVIVRKNHTGHQ